MKRFLYLCVLLLLNLPLFAETGDHLNVEMVGKFSYWGSCWDMAKSDHYIYVAAGQDGIRILDVSDYEHVFECGVVFPEGPIYYLTISGNYLYAGDYDFGIRIYDITNPSEITQIGTFATEGPPREIVVEDSFAYIACEFAGLRILDISDPTNPCECGVFDNDSFAIGVTIEGNRAFLSCSNDGLYIIDISCPPILLTQGYFDTPGNAVSVEIVDNYALVADWDSGIRILDISDLNHIFEAASYEISEGASHIKIIGEYGYLIDDDGLTVVLANNLPHLRLEERGIAHLEGYNYCTYFENDTMFFSGRSCEGIEVFDMSNGHLGILQSVGTFSSQCFLTDVKVKENYAYVAADNYGLRVFDISTPVNLHEVGFLDQLGIVSDLYVLDNYVFATSDFQGVLNIIDITDPLEPFLASRIDTLEYSNCIDIIGDYMFVTADQSDLWIFDITYPISPTFVSSLSAPGEMKGVKVFGDLAYIASYDNGLRIVDVSDPYHPEIISSFNTPGYAMGIDIQGNYAYIADGWQGLCIVDISDPENPCLVGSSPGSNTLKVQVEGSYAYLIDVWNGLMVVDVTDPTSPGITGYYETEESAFGVTVVEDYAYVANWKKFYIFDKSEATWINEEPRSTLPDKFEISHIYPNPFNPTVNFTISLPEPGQLDISIFNLVGQRVALIGGGMYENGQHKFIFNGSSISSGVYLIQAKFQGSRIQNRRITLVK